MNRVARRSIALLACVALAAGAAGCGEKDPGALGPEGVSGLSKEAKAQEYGDGLARAFQQLGKGSGDPQFRAIDAGDKRQLQVAALSWDQGVETLQQLDPPSDVVGPHKRLVAATKALGVWNAKMVAAAPNKKRVQAIAKQAFASPESKAYGKAICEFVDLGFQVVEQAQCGPLDKAGAAGGDTNPRG